MAVRTMVKIDQALVERMRLLVPAEELNRFINDAIEARLQQAEREKLEARIKAGYLTNRWDKEEFNPDRKNVKADDWTLAAFRGALRFHL